MNYVKTRLWIVETRHALSLQSTIHNPQIRNLQSENCNLQSEIHELRTTNQRAMRIFTPFLCLLALHLFLTPQLNCAYAQEDKIKITGIVIEDLSEEPIPFANVYLKGTTVGTVTDLDGRFVLESKRLSDTLAVSAVGQEPMFKPISKAAKQLINFRMGRADVMMEEFVVLAGENPADILMRKVIKNKKHNDEKQRESYQCEIYNKLELDLTDIDEKFQNRKIFKPFKFIFENVDSFTEEKPFLPAFLTETVSDFYYKNNPSNEKEVIKASKISGLKNESITQFLGNMYQKIDIYQNRIPVLGKSFSSPISNQAFFYYKFALMDSAVIDGKWCYQLAFKPKRKQENTFIGDMWIADSSFAVRRLSMEIVAKDANVNFIRRLSVFQEFNTVVDTNWAMTKDKLIVDFISTKNGPGIIGRKTTSLRDYLFEEAKTLAVFEDKEDLIVEEDVFDKPESYWQEARHEKLTENEASVYAMIDTIQNIPIMKTYIEIVNTVVSGYYRAGKINLGPYFSLVSFNTVEGWRIRLGARTNTRLSDRFMIGGYAAYGFKDKDIKYGADGLYVLSRKPWQTVRIDYMNDLDLQSDSREEFGQDNFLAGLYRRQEVPQKLTRVHRLMGTYSRDWGLGFSNQLSAAHKRLDPYFNFYYNNVDFENGGIADSTVHTTEFAVNFRFAYKEKFLSGKYYRSSLGSQYPILNIKYTAGVSGIIGSKFNYHKVEARLYDRIPLGPIGYTEVIATGGKIFGTLPFLLLEDFPGNETFFFNKYSFNRMNQYEFISDTYGTLFLTHFFDGAIMNKFPLIRKLKLRSLVSAKFAVGSLSEKNRRANMGDGENRNFSNFESLQDWELQSPSFREPYIEVGVGIENILRLFRVDAIWRLTYTDTPAKVGIRTGMQVKF